MKCYDVKLIFYFVHTYLVSRTYWRPCAPRRRHVAGPVEVAKVLVRLVSVARCEGVGKLLRAHAVYSHGEVAAEFRRRNNTEICDQILRSITRSLISSLIPVYLRCTHICVRAPLLCQGK